MAAESARNLEKRMSEMNNTQVRAMMLTFRGVSAVNRNDWSAAKQDFVEAHKLDPEDAFTLNNLGYVAEKSGDLESAQFYYSQARHAYDANARVGLATKQPAQGQRLFAVASENGGMVGDELVQYKEQRQLETGPITLIPRGNGAQQPSQPQSPSQPQ
jgi:Tfp pilus assembly protein PilF